MATANERRGKVSQTSRVRSLVIDRIMSGRYPLGTKLPSSRELAAELASNHTAVSSAYKQLTELGIVSMVWGKGSFVARKPPKPDGQDLHEFENKLERILRDALSSGLSQSQVTTIVQRNLDLVMRDNVARVAVVECNEHDVNRCIRSIEQHLPARVTGVLLSEVMAQGGNALDQFDLISVTYFHLEQLLNLVPEARDRIIGLNYVPTSKSTSVLATLPHGTKIVTACATGQGIQSYPGLAHMYGCEVVGAWSPDRPESELTDLVTDGAYVMSSVAAAEAIAALKINVDPIVVRFHVDNSSLTELSHRVEQLSAELSLNKSGTRLPPLATGDTS